MKENTTEVSTIWYIVLRSLVVTPNHPKTKETSFGFTVNVIQWVLIKLANDEKGHPDHTICVSEGLD